MYNNQNIINFYKNIKKFNSIFCRNTLFNDIFYLQFAKLNLIY